jgi:hypothetical protein
MRNAMGALGKPRTRSRNKPSQEHEGQAEKLVQYNFRSRVYNSNENVKAAVIDGLYLLIPTSYKRVTGGGAGTRMYQTTDNPR